MNLHLMERSYQKYDYPSICAGMKKLFIRSSQELTKNGEIVDVRVYEECWDTDTPTISSLWVSGADWKAV